MSQQIIVEQTMVVDGKNLKVSLIQNPTIDDVLVTEAELQAYRIETGDPQIDERRVGRDLRDFLIRIGVER